MDKKRLTKAQKKANKQLERIQTLKAKSKEQRPEKRHKKHERLMNDLHDKSKEEIDAHFLAIRQKKEAGIKRFQECQQDPKAAKIVIDLSFSQHMGNGEKSSLCS